MKTVHFYLISFKNCSQNVGTTFLVLHRYQKNNQAFMFQTSIAVHSSILIKNDFLFTSVHFQHLNYQLFLSHCVSLINIIILNTIFLSYNLINSMSYFFLYLSPSTLCEIIKIIHPLLVKRKI